MASSTLKFLLGLYPNTEHIEQKRDALIKEFEKLNTIAKSDELARYNTLDQFVFSSEFAEKKRYYQTLGYKNSEEEQKEKEYLRLKNSHDVKFYYKFKASPAYAQYKSMDGTKEIKDFEKLRDFIESEEFRKVEEYMKDKKKWEKTDEFRKFQEYQTLLQNPSIKSYIKFTTAKTFTNFKKLYQSPEIETYQEREKYLQSQDFLSKKATLKGNEFKQSDAYRKLVEFQTWKKASHYKDYFKMVNSQGFYDFKNLDGSKQIQEFQELENFVKSPQYKEKKIHVDSQRFEQTEEYRKQQEYKRLVSSQRIKSFYKMKSSKELAEFISLEGSSLIPDYEKLEKLVLSDKFKTQKAYLLDKKKWEKTDEYKQLLEYNTLKKKPDIIWYFKYKDSGKYDELKNWNLVFSDEFNEGKLDRKKWLARYFWGEMLLKDSYALPGEKHLFTDGKNLEFGGSAIKMITRSEKISGKEWIPSLGFYPKEYNYSSGLICSGSSFRTKYGKIEAKIKLDASKDIMHAFWLTGDTILPQIDIFKCANNKLFLSTFWGDAAETNGVQKNTLSISASKFTGKYFIYSFEWTPDKMVWRINDVEVKSQTSNIPGDNMYVVINSGVVGDQPQIPTRMEVDWIRCYQKN
jgi:hypothetical protein